MLLHIILIEAFKGVTDYHELSNYITLTNYLGVLVLIPLWRVSVVLALKRYRRKGFNYKKVIVLGADATTKDLLSFFDGHPEHGYRVMGVLGKDSAIESVTHDVTEFEKLCIEKHVEEIYCFMHRFSENEISSFVNFAQNNLIKIHFVPRAEGFNYKRLKVQSYGLLPVLSISPTPLDEILNRVMKRVFDVVFSSIVILLLLSWLMPILAIVIKLNSRGPVFFKQKRSGLKNADFWCLKLRTMKVNLDSDKVQATKNDSRVTKLGAFLRKTSLDELPQFFNVWVGDMSIIGPRPHMVAHTEEYSKLIDNYLVRHFVKPGITGLSQVMGYRGQTEELYQMRNRIKIDVFYLEHWSFWLDMKILALTIINVFKKEEMAY